MTEAAPATLLPGEAAAARLPGLAELAFTRRGGRTALSRCVARPPLQVQRALYLDEALPDMAFVYLANPTAGIFQGDRLRVSISLEAGARAHLATPAATKIYAMPQGEAAQETQLTLAAGSCLEWLPEPLIPFRGARFRQTTNITVAPGATLIYGDLLAPGRQAHGESLAYARFGSRLTISRPDGTPLYHEAFDLAPAERSPLGLGLLGDGQALGTLLLVSDAAPPAELRDKLREALDRVADARWGVSRLAASGVGVKALGPDTAAVRRALRVAWAAARLALLNAPPPAPRRY